MMGLVIPYSDDEKQLIAENLSLNTSEILSKMIELSGNKRNLGALRRYIAENHNKPVYRANRRPEGSTRTVRGRVQVKVGKKWIKKDRIDAGAKDDEYTCYDQNGKPIAISKGEHLRLSVLGYFTAPKEVKKSLLMIAKISQLAKDAEK